MKYVQIIHTDMNGTSLKLKWLWPNKYGYKRNIIVQKLENALSFNIKSKIFLKKIAEMQKIITTEGCFTSKDSPIFEYWKFFRISLNIYSKGAEKI